MNKKLYKRKKMKPLASDENKWTGIKFSVSSVPSVAKNNIRR
jgi:hypothetical protein